MAKTETVFSGNVLPIRPEVKQGKRAKKSPRGVDKIHAQHHILGVVSSRLREARELANMSQCVAAQRLGYANSSKLARIESGTDLQSIPLWVVSRAAQLYEVSVDWLFGATDDWEIGIRMTQEREVSSWLMQAWEAARRRDLEALKRLHDRLDVLREAVSIAVQTSEATAQALSRVQALNPDAWEDIRGGAKLVSCIETQEKAAIEAKRRLERFKLDCLQAGSAGTSNDPRQVSLFSLL